MVVVIFITWCCQASLSFLLRQHKLQYVFTDCCRGVYFNPLCFSPSVLCFTGVWKWRFKNRAGPLTGPIFRVVASGLGEGRGFKILSWLLWQSWSSLSGHSREWEGESGRALESMHYFTHSKWQPSTQAQMPTNAGVSLCVCVCLCVSIFHLCVCVSSFMPLLLWKLPVYSMLHSQITWIKMGKDLDKLFKVFWGHVL